MKCKCNMYSSRSGLVPRPCNGRSPSGSVGFSLASVPALRSNLLPAEASLSGIRHLLSLSVVSSLAVCLCLLQGSTAQAAIDTEPDKGLMGGTYLLDAPLKRKKRPEDRKGVPASPEDSKPGPFISNDGEDKEYDFGGQHIEGYTAGNGAAIYNINQGKIHFTGQEGEATFENNTAEANGGAIYNDTKSSLTFDGDVSFDHNTAEANGGAIYNDSKSSLTFNGDASFKNNTAVYSGGAIYNYNSSMTFTGDASFDHNTAPTSGAVDNYYNSSITFNGDASFDHNTARFNGGAVYNFYNSSVTFNGDASFKENTAEANGGAINNDYGSSMTFHDSASFENNAVSQFGGAIYNESNSFLTFTGDASFEKNTAGTNGGAICNQFSSPMTFNGDASFESNTAESDGGAIYIYTSELTFKKHASFESNTAKDDGGAIYNYYNSSMTFDGDASFKKNTAGSGGAIENQDNSSITFNGDASFKENTAGSGGAIYNHNSSMTFTGDASFENNTATSQEGAGGAIYNAGTLNLTPGEGKTVRFSGNSDPTGPNSIFMYNNGILNVGGSGLIDMPDPMRGSANDHKSITINKVGSGTWKLGGNNEFSGEGSATFKVSDGKLYLYGKGEVSGHANGNGDDTGTRILLYGPGSTFTLENGGTLSVGGMGTEINAPQINLEDGSTLQFDAANHDGSDNAMLDLTGNLTQGEQGDINIDLTSINQDPLDGPQTHRKYKLVQAGDDVDFSGLNHDHMTIQGEWNPTYKGEKLSDTRGKGTVTVSGDNHGEIWLDQTATADNLSMRWTGASTDWEYTKGNWTGGPGNNVHKFWDGDYVTFDGDGFSDVNINDKGVIVAGMDVGGGNYTFTGGELRSAASNETTLKNDPALYTKRLDIHNATVRFANSRLSFENGVNVGSGGVLAVGPEDHTGTLQVDGPLSFTDGSTYQVRLTKDGSDKINSSGDVMIGKGSTLQILNGSPDGGIWKTGGTYTVIHTDKQISSTFERMEAGNLPFLKITQNLDNDNRDLDLKTEYNSGINPDPSPSPSPSPSPFPSPHPHPHPIDHGTENERNTNTGVAGLPSGHPVQDAIANSPGDTGLHLLDLASGEAHVSTANMLFDHFRRQASSTLWRLSWSGMRASRMSSLQVATTDDVSLPEAAPPSFNGLWAQVSGFHSSYNSNGNASEGVLYGPEVNIGYDRRSENGWIAGVALRYGDLRSRVSDRMSQADIDSYGLALYGGKETPAGPGSLRVVAGAGYTYDDLETRRGFAGPGLQDRMKTDYGAHNWQTFGEAAYLFQPHERVNLEPFANFSWEGRHTESFSESGDAAALRGSSQNRNGFTSQLGFRAYMPAFERVSFGLETAWVHNYGELDGSQRLAFRDGGNDFLVRGVNASRDEARLGLGMGIKITKDVRVNLSYDGWVGGDSATHGGTARLTWNW